MRGNQLVSRETILSAVSARPGQRVTAAQLTADVEVLRRLGFFQTVQTPQVVITPDGARITYVVVEFPRVRGVEFTGNTVFTQEELRRILEVVPG